MLSHHPSAPILLLAGALLTGCAAHPENHISPSRSSGILTAEQIQRMAGETAWDVLLRAGVPLIVGENMHGEPAQFERRRGSQIGSRADRPMLVVNGLPVQSITWLAQIPKDMIHSIQIVHRLSDLPIAVPLTGRPSLIVSICTRDASC